MCEFLRRVSRDCNPSRVPAIRSSACADDSDGSWQRPRSARRRGESIGAADLVRAGTGASRYDGFGETVSTLRRSRSGVRVRMEKTPDARVADALRRCPVVRRAMGRTTMGSPRDRASNVGVHPGVCDDGRPVEQGELRSSPEPGRWKGSVRDGGRYRPRVSTTWTEGVRRHREWFGQMVKSVWRGAQEA